MGSSRWEREGRATHAHGDRLKVSHRVVSGPPWGKHKSPVRVGAVRRRGLYVVYWE